MRKGAPRDNTAEGRGRLHRKLMQAIAPEATRAEVLCAVHGLLNTVGEDSLAAYLDNEGFASFLYEQTTKFCEAGDVPERMKDELRRARWIHTGMYMAQKAALSSLDILFNEAGIEYAVFKGVHIRELVYADPSVRPACDIDVLVAPRKRKAAISALVRSGFELQVNADNTSHEVTLVKGPVAVDLHWDIMRPGRTRVPICELFLKRRQRVGGFWGLDDTSAVFVMLVHPAFAKWVCNLALCSVADFERWLRTSYADWNLVEALLSQTGLKTAAWAVVTWFSLRFPPDSPFPPPDFLKRIEPGPLRRAWIRYWLPRDLPIRFGHIPLVPQTAFTVPLHDSALDALRFLTGRMRAGAQDIFAGRGRNYEEELS
jgi:hypothetical protein